MDIQFWIWLIVIVVSLIARANKKKPQPGPQEPRQFNSPEPTSKPISFEDLLREIQASKAPKQEPAPRKYDFEDYDDDLKEEAQELETTERSYEKPSYSRNDDEIYETYEKAKSAAFYRPSLEETMKVEDTVVRFGQFKGYEQKETVNVASEYVKELSDPEGFRKAFILSEILNRKF